MAEKEWQDLTRREKDQRRVDAYKAGVKDIETAYTDGGMDHDKARAKAKDEQEKISNRSWSEYQRNDGHK